MVNVKSIAALLLTAAGCTFIVIVMAELMTIAYDMLERSGLLSLSFVNTL